jgi:hypothetical protein
MSLLRTVYLGAILCGWMAFGGWFLAEILRQGVAGPDSAAGMGDSAAEGPRFLGSPALGSLLASERNQTIASFCLVGAAIGAGLGLASGLSNWRMLPQLFRMVRGLVAGALGGIAGGWVGAMIYQAFVPINSEGGSTAAPWWLRPLGWMAAGGLVGLADGLFTLSGNRMRNGLFGGLVGGLIGGALFDPIKVLVARAAGAGDPTLQFEITSRAAGFVAVGLCIGAAVGLTHVLLKHAWVTVLDGDRPGRQVILSGSGLTLGSDPGAGVPFLRDVDRSLLPKHAQIMRGGDGSFSLVLASGLTDADATVVRSGVREAWSSRTQPAKGIILENDCVIICGRNSIRFNEKSHSGELSGPRAAAERPAAPPSQSARVQPVAPASGARHAESAAQPSPPPRPVPQPQAAVAAPFLQQAEPAAAAVSRRSIAPLGETSSAPAPSAPAKAVAGAQPSPPQPDAMPAPQPAGPTSPEPRVAAGASNVCPNGHSVPAGQRYCMVCDTYF